MRITVHGKARTVSRGRLYAIEDPHIHMLVSSDGHHIEGEGPWDVELQTVSVSAGAGSGYSAINLHGKLLDLHERPEDGAITAEMNTGYPI